MNWGEARGFAGSCVRPNYRGCICLTFLRCVFSNVSSKLNWGGGTWLRRHPCVRPNYRGCPGDTRGRCSSPAWSTIDWFYTSSVKRPPPAGLIMTRKFSLLCQMLLTVVIVGNCLIVMWLHLKDISCSFRSRKPKQQCQLSNINSNQLIDTDDTPH